MKKQKLASILLCAVMATSALTACKVKTKDPVTADTLQIVVVARGYGAAYAKELARIYKRKTSVDAKVVLVTPDGGFADNQVQAGPRSNKTDIYFANNNIFSMLSQKGLVDGYDYVWADLSEVYDAPAVGWKELEANPNLKNKDIFDAYALDAITYKDNKQYAVPWSMAVYGLLYNKTLWDRVNDRLDAGNKLELPKTTKEMFALWDRIKALPAATRENAYVYSYSGLVDYNEMLFYSWWPQYESKEAIDKFLEGKDINGQYTADIYNTEARLQAFTAASEVLKRSNGYSDSISHSKDFLQAQLEFLQGKAFFTPNGDWLETEASSQFDPGEADVGFIKTPVLSSLANKLTSFNQFTGDGKIKGNTDQKDQKLREMLDWIDGGKTGDAPWTISPADLAFLENSRSRIASGCTEYQVLVPSYSAHLKEAKEFLKFMLSKEGQEIMVSSAFGTMSPLRIDTKQFDFYNPDPIGDKNSEKSTYMCNSKWELFRNSLPLTKTFNKYPMQYLGTMIPLRGLPYTLEAAFGVAVGTPKTPAEFQAVEYGYYDSMWKQMMSDAGVSN